MRASSWSTGFGNRLLDAVLPPRAVYAHCDIPCGIYDPHEAQIAALTVIRMDQLIAELIPPPADAKPEDRTAFVSKLARYTAVKEAHSERVKSEVRVIWGDFFTPDHAAKFPQVHDLVWKILKQASKTRQGTATRRRAGAAQAGAGVRGAVLAGEGCQDPPRPLNAETGRRTRAAGVGPLWCSSRTEPPPRASLP